ncbi:UNVERIFIED_CONTAM: cytochrome [Sesamum radiatum]|uniref:Cytochrome n=1 Tax=Sesamum radiatum TaxID=300843 RepID=A0AAW2JQW2_SESRA
MAELLHNPSILAKAKQELSKEIPPRQIVQEQDISRLPYLVGVTKEALRLHPIAPILVPHQTEQEVEIHGYTIPKHTQDFKYIPFGAGRRICPGSSLAMRMVSLMLANLVHNFDWELPNGLKPEDLDMNDGLGMTLHKHEPLVVIPVDHVA